MVDVRVIVYVIVEVFYPSRIRASTVKLNNIVKHIKGETFGHPSMFYWIMENYVIVNRVFSYPYVALPHHNNYNNQNIYPNRCSCVVLCACL